jgi:hypothetical protein
VRIVKPSERLDSKRARDESFSSAKTKWSLRTTVLFGSQLGTFVSAAAVAAPMIIQPNAKITLPDPSFATIEDVAVSGNTIVVAASKLVPTGEEYQYYLEQEAFLYERAGNGSWRYVQTLTHSLSDPWSIPLSVDVQGNLLAVNGPGKQTNPPGNRPNTLDVFERTSTGWVSRPAQVYAQGPEIDIESRSIFASDGQCNWGAMQIDAFPQPPWVMTKGYPGDYYGCDDENLGGDIDATLGYVIIAVPFGEQVGGGGAAYVYRTSSGGPKIITSPEGGDTQFGDSVAIGNGSGAFVTGTATSGVYHFLDVSAQGWTRVHTLVTPDTLMAGFPGALTTQEQLIAHNRADGVALYQYSGGFGPGTDPKYVAILDGIRNADISGSRVVGIEGNHVSVFDLPSDFTQPQMHQDDFEDGNSADWVTQAGSTYAVVSTTNSRVYRQSNLNGNAVSILSDTDWKNQSIQADIKPTAFDGTDRWYGLLARYTDAGNYYYVTGRTSNTIQLRKMVNGSIQTLASATLPFALNSTYNVRLEAIGPDLRVYVDGKQLFKVSDTNHPHGQVGLMTYKMRADYDNVIVTPNRLGALLTDDFEKGTSLWTATAGSWGIVAEGTTYSQLSTLGTPRAITGIATDDQIIQARVKPTGYATGKPGWFGLMARHVDDSNYYYLRIGSDNTISLRKLVNGAIQTLASAPLTATTGTWYALRLEAVGNKLRAYVNGRLIVQATDSSHAQGRYGAVMYQATARYDDVRVTQP